MGIMVMKIENVANRIPVFGEVGVDTVSGSVRVKVNMRGIICMMGGYCTDSAGDCYKMFDPINNTTYMKQEMRFWLNRVSCQVYNTSAWYSGCDSTSEESKEERQAHNILSFKWIGRMVYWSYKTDSIDDDIINFEADSNDEDDEDDV
ncbi:hypothetical protein FRACYDRAFT_264707 [Fragilariopsis cylindrus CCMP1102]|uniref:Uncharacterized protein n=1 Tax=Fragilariopsis cylindrus CCMP1102 TaxID=635003 RepID=A0A1E7EQE8_9STRA|nr:hypothetical protein FRACYDRAFT_264707 [Fragilariopsis cylindrus CCMP1102]|eukprot:OEU08016.1 hypothetical protein FRACYDRAFT_264707 [Fragilariopsis cylindrus CCMP1102]